MHATRKPSDCPHGVHIQDCVATCCYPIYKYGVSFPTCSVFQLVQFSNMFSFPTCSVFRHAQFSNMFSFPTCSVFQHVQFSNMFSFPTCSVFQHVQFPAWVRSWSSRLSDIRLYVYCEGYSLRIATGRMSSLYSNLWVCMYTCLLMCTWQSEAVRQIPKCQIRLYEAVCVIISLLPPDHCAYYTQQFLAPHLQRLSELCSQPVRN